jgi:hypothetical protein
VVAKTFPVDAALVRLHVALTLAEAVVVDALHAATLQISRAEGLATTTILQGLNVKCVQRLATLQKSVGIDEDDSNFEPHTVALASSSAADNNWYTDSGATDHITGDLDKLTMHDPYYSNDQIHTANRSGMDITHVSNTIIPTPTHDLILNNVFHVFTSHKNLISIHRFTLDNDTFIEFHPYFFIIKDQ